MKILKSTKANFKEEFARLVRRGETDMRSVMPVVSGIIEDIRERGDEALAEQIEKFDRWRVQGDLAITQEQMSRAYEGLSAELKKRATSRIRAHLRLSRKAA